MLQFSPILSCRRWFEVILQRIYYVMSCVRPQLGADCFHPKWAVDSSYSWNVHCFQIRWRNHHSARIGIEKQLAQPSQCCNESGKYCPRLLPTTKIQTAHNWSGWLYVSKNNIGAEQFSEANRGICGFLKTVLPYKRWILPMYGRT